MSSGVPADAATGGGGLGAGRVFAIVLGSLLALLAITLVIGGAVLVGAHLTQRDDDGFYTSASERLATRTYAITGEGLDLGDVEARGGDWTIDDLDARVRVRARAEGGAPVFVGIAPERRVTAYLRGVPHAEVTDVGDDGPEVVTYGGSRRPVPPVAARIWAASASGPGTRTAEWEAEGGRWSAVIMNPDGARGVVADVSVGARLSLLLWLGLGAIALGLVLGGAATGLLLAGLREPRGGTGPAPGPGAPAPGAGAPRPGTAAPAGAAPAAVEPTPGPGTAAPAAGAPAAVEPTETGEPPPPPYPLELRARPGEPLSRWLWIVKPLLLIPHYIVLAVLWAAFVVLTLVGIVAVLVTGRLPRAIFDFNEGVLRWSWRVAYYGPSAFATDRYPPFTLEPADHPADLHVPRPDRVSRATAPFRLLLALPHLAILASLYGWWEVSDEGFVPPGVLPVLILVAVVVLVVRGRYPRDVFELVVGIGRWGLRVGAYVGLLRDEYPPFRLRP